jgi:hypothetical protein
MPSPARSPTSRSQTQTAGSARPWLSPGMLHSARPHGRQYLQMATRGYQNRIRYSGVGTSPIRPTDGPLARQPVETLLSEPPGSLFLHGCRLQRPIVDPAESILMELAPPHGEGGRSHPGCKGASQRHHKSWGPFVRPTPTRDRDPVARCRGSPPLPDVASPIPAASAFPTRTPSERRLKGE